MPGKLVALLRALPLPAVIGAIGLAFLLLLSRMDGAQSARLAALDQQQDKATQQTLQAARTWKATRKASEAAQAEIARLRAAEAVLAQRNARLRAQADSLTASLQPVLAGLPDSVVFHVEQVLSAKDSVIATQDARIANLTVQRDSLAGEASRWAGEAQAQRNLAQVWQDQAKAYRKEARRGCLPLLGCVSRTTVALVAGGLGFAGGVLASR